MELLLLITYICLFAALAAIILITAVMFYKHKFVGQHKLSLESPHFKGRSQVYTPRFGWCVSIGHDMTGDNSAILHLQDDNGNQYPDRTDLRRRTHPA